MSSELPRDIMYFFAAVEADQVLERGKVAYGEAIAQAGRGGVLGAAATGNR